MKRFLLGLAVAAAVSPAFATDVGVSVSIGQPGFYGRIDLGTFPQPRLIYPTPMIVTQPAIGVPMGRPIYLHVPPGHAKDWHKHCRKYNACAQPVYFVQESWYNDVYVPQYRQQRGGPGYAAPMYQDGRGYDDHPGKGKGKGNNGHGKGKKDD